MSRAYNVSLTHRFQHCVPSSIGCLQQCVSLQGMLQPLRVGSNGRFKVLQRHVSLVPDNFTTCTTGILCIPRTSPTVCMRPIPTVICATIGCLQSSCALFTNYCTYCIKMRGNSHERSQVGARLALRCPTVPAHSGRRLSPPSADFQPILLLFAFRGSLNRVSSTSC